MGSQRVGHDSVTNTSTLFLTTQTPWLWAWKESVKQINAGCCITSTGPSPTENGSESLSSWPLLFFLGLCSSHLLDTLPGQSESLWTQSSVDWVIITKQPLQPTFTECPVAGVLHTIIHLIFTTTLLLSPSLQLRKLRPTVTDPPRVTQQSQDSTSGQPDPKASALRHHASQSCSFFFFLTASGLSCMWDLSLPTPPRD